MAIRWPILLKCCARSPVRISEMSERSSPCGERRRRCFPLPRVASAAAALTWTVVTACGPPSEPIAPSRFSSDSELAGWATPSGSDIDSVLGLPSKVVRIRDGMEMKLVPAGTFLMGAIPGDERAEDAERPRHSVTLGAFYIDTSEVTEGMFVQWRAAVGGVTTPPTADELPVSGVSWKDATAYAQWAGVDLPTEAQWERAARGSDQRLIYPWGDSDDVAVRQGPDSVRSVSQRVRVRSFPPNGLGVYDMSGNVAEWCRDYWSSEYYQKTDTQEPSGPPDGQARVVRGGSFRMNVSFFRCSARYAQREAIRRSDIGFRCVRPIRRKS